MQGCYRSVIPLLQLLALIGASSAFAGDDDVVGEGSAVDTLSGDSGVRLIRVQLEVGRFENAAPAVLNLRPAVRVGNAQQLRQVQWANFQFVDFKSQKPDYLQNVSIQIDSEVESAIRRIDKICDLTDHQRQKLRLAGRTDRKRFLELFSQARDNSNNANGFEIHNELIAIEKKVRDGVLDADSFFYKSARFFLNEDQLARLAKYRASKHRESAELVIADMDKAVKLTESQREALHQLIVELAPPPTEFEINELFRETADRWVIWYKLAVASEQKVKPIVDPEQWIELSPRLKVYLQFKQYLTRKGLIVADAAGDDSH